MANGGLHHIVVIDERSKRRYTVANLGPEERPWVAGRSDGRGETHQAKTLAGVLIKLAGELEPEETLESWREH